MADECESQMRASETLIDDLEHRENKHADPDTAARPELRGYVAASRLGVQTLTPSVPMRNSTIHGGSFSTSEPMVPTTVNPSVVMEELVRTRS